MTIRSRILLGFIIITGTGFYILFDFIANEIRPRYLETVEESLNDSVNILASMVESEVSNNSLNLKHLERIFKGAFLRQFEARIYAIKKEKVSLHIYITNSKGIVLFDTRNPSQVGHDYSKWNDVHLTLKGKYGARSTRVDPNDPNTSTLYVAAPIHHKNKLLGVITVVKPPDNIATFVGLARARLLYAAITTAILFSAFGFILSFWINRPIQLLQNYVHSLRINKRQSLPKLRTPELRHLGESFETLFTELEGKRYIEQYIQTMTHELKSPLTSIRGAAELLQEEMPSEDKQRFYQNIEKESRRMEAIIMRLLNLSALENRSSIKNVETINLKKLIDEIILSLEPQLREKDITIKMNINAQVNITVEEFLIRQSIENLLQNAIKFSTYKSEIHLAVIENDINLELSITDEGQGIPSFAIDKIFDRFYSLPTQGSTSKGTGLGLPFAKEAVELHGGSITIVNRVNGSGIVAKIILPFHPSFTNPSS